MGFADQRQQVELKYAVIESLRERAGAPVEQVDLEESWEGRDVRELVESVRRCGEVEVTGTGEQAMRSLII